MNRSRSSSPSHPILKIVPGLAGSGTARAAGGSTVGVNELVDLRVGVILRGNHRDWKFALCAVAGLHDLAYAQTAVLCWDVRLLAVR